MPTTVPSLYSIILYARRIPFAVEVAADPYDGYSAESLGNHPLSPFFQWAFTRLMRWQCRSAVAVAYVTRSALQKRYPARSAQASFSFTSIDLIPRAFASQPRVYNHKGDSAFKLVIIGNMQKTLKGHDILLKSLAKLREEGRNVFLTIIGYGENLEFYKSMASSLGLTESVNFTGKLENGDPIRDVLDKSDLFVLPSRQEGLPRALLEAMARGLPAVASRVGGTPELLEDYALVEANDTNGLTERIRYFMDCPERMSKESIRNLGVARTYSSDKVKAQRDLFFDYVKEHSGAA
ncbi:MAG: glycosyltransferase [Luteimonas sp.]